MKHLASGRRIVNLCLFSWLAARAFDITQPSLALVFLLGSMVAVVIGMLRISRGLELSGWFKTFVVIGSCIPVVGLLVAVWFSSRASRALRSAGYQVGIFISRKSHVA